MQQHQQQENDVLSCRELSAFFLSTDRKEAMLDYEWGNATSIILPGEEPTSDSDQTRQIFDSYNQTLTGNFIQPPAGFSTQPFQQQPHQLPLLHNSQTPLHQTFDSRGYAPSYPRPPVPQSTAGFPPGQHFPPLGPKTEEYHCSAGDFSSPIGLNLGFRTYFSSTEDDLVSRLYRRARPAEPSNSPRCQAEGCNADLTHAKHYHRRHKVCEFHSKASTVLAGGLTQRFCQQCSRFHLLSEFDQGKRSCRKRLADHNRRRRKSQPQPPPPPQSENASTSLARVETSSSNLLSFSRWAGIPRPHFLKFQFLTACWHLIFPCLLSLSQSRLRNRARRLLRLLQSACRHLRNSRSTASDLRRWERRLLRRGRYSLREGLSVLMNAGSGTRKKKVGRRRNAATRLHQDKQPETDAGWEVGTVATRSSDGLDLARSIQMRSLLKMRCMGHFSATFGEVDKPNFDQVACLIHPSASSISARINPLVSRADQRALATCLAILLN